MGSRGIGVGKGLKVGDKFFGLVALLDKTLGLSDLLCNGKAVIN